MSSPIIVALDFDTAAAALALSLCRRGQTTQKGLSERHGREVLFKLVKYIYYSLMTL